MLALSPSLELSSLSSLRCLQVYNCRNFHASSVSESRSVVTFQLPLSPRLQLSVLSCLLCLQVWNCRHFQACTPLKSVTVGTFKHSLSSLELSSFCSFPWLPWRPSGDTRIFVYPELNRSFSIQLQRAPPSESLGVSKYRPTVNRRLTDG